MPGAGDRRAGEGSATRPGQAAPRSRSPERWGWNRRSGAQGSESPAGGEIGLADGARRVGVVPATMRAISAERSGRGRGWRRRYRGWSMQRRAPLRSNSGPSEGGPCFPGREGRRGLPRSPGRSRSPSRRRGAARMRWCRKPSLRGGRAGEIGASSALAVGGERAAGEEAAVAIRPPSRRGRSRFAARSWRWRWPRCRWRSRSWGTRQQRMTSPRSARVYRGVEPRGGRSRSGAPEPVVPHG